MAHNGDLDNALDSVTKNQASYDQNNLSIICKKLSLKVIFTCHRLEFELFKNQYAHDREILMEQISPECPLKSLIYAADLCYKPNLEHATQLIQNINIDALNQHHILYCWLLGDFYCVEGRLNQADEWLSRSVSLIERYRYHRTTQDLKIIDRMNEVKAMQSTIKP